MATNAAVKFTEADAGALLRRSQIEAQRAPMLNNSLASPNFTAANEPANNDTYFPQSVANAERTLSPGQAFQAQQQREKQAYQARALGRAPGLNIPPGAGADTAAATAGLGAQEASTRSVSRGRDVSQLGPVRGLRQQIADQAAQIASDRAKAKFKELTSRYIVLAADELGGGVAEVTEGAAAETDGGFFTLSDIAYDYARAAVTVLVPPAEDVGTTVVETARYTTNKTIHLLIPPYKFVFGGATFIDLIDDAMAIFKLGIVSMLILTVALFVAIVIVLVVEGIFAIPGFSAFVSTVASN